jgi:hypothetical protein
VGGLLNLGLEARHHAPPWRQKAVEMTHQLQSENKCLSVTWFICVAASEEGRGRAVETSFFVCVLKMAGDKTEQRKMKVLSN